MIPVRIGIPESSHERIPVLIFELTNAVQPDILARLREAEHALREHLGVWRRLLERARVERGDPSPRLELGAELDAFFGGLRRDSGLHVVNQEDALTSLLDVSRADLDYIRRASRQFSLEDVRKYRLRWSQILAITGIRDASKLHECLELIAAGDLRTQDELRAFRRVANSAI